VLFTCIAGPNLGKRFQLTEPSSRGQWPHLHILNISFHLMGFKSLQWLALE